MRKSILVYLIIVVFCSVSGCDSVTPNSEKPQEAQIYISFTVTNEIISKTPGTLFESHVFCYDIQSQALHEVATVPYNSQYPLTAYDRPENKVYFSASALKGGRMRNASDKLYSLDLTNNEIKVLTNNLYAINYIIPTRNNIILVACPLDSPEITLMLYSWDKSSRKLKELSWESDITFSKVYYQPDTHYLIASTFSSSEDLFRIRNQDKTPYITPDKEVYRIDFNNAKHEKLFALEGNNLIVSTDINSIVLNDNKIVAFIREKFKDGYYVFSEEGIYSFDYSGDERTPFIDREKLKGLSDLVYISNDKRFIYFISSALGEQSSNALCKYDTVTDKIEIIYEAVLGYNFINNATALSDYR